MKKNKIYLIIIIAIVFITIVPKVMFSQHISFVNDYLRNVEIFDNGNIKQIEHLPFKSYMVTNSSLAYEDNAGNFKIYHDNYLHNASTFISNYKATDNLIGFNMNTQLKVFDNGEMKNLCVNITDYFVGDDLVVWFDDFEKRLKVYFNKEVYDIDDALATGEMNEVKVGENTVAFVDSKNYMNVFYDGVVDQICYADRIKSLELGRDIIAFVEEPLNNFQVYYFGEFIDVENFEPISYKAGDGFVAYVDANNYLKVFCNYETKTISFDNPDFYKVEDKIMVFGEKNYFKAYYNGQIFTLESYIPSDYKMNNNIVCYLDQMGNLKIFNGQKTETISYEDISNYEIHGSVVKYTFGVNSENLYYGEKTYKND